MGRLPAFGLPTAVVQLLRIEPHYKIKAVQVRGCLSEDQPPPSGSSGKIGETARCWSVGGQLLYQVTVSIEPNPILMLQFNCPGTYVLQALRQLLA